MQAAIGSAVGSGRVWTGAAETGLDHASILKLMAGTRPDIDVARVAALARLELTPEETALFTTQLTDILAYAEAVQQIDTSGVPPTSHVGGDTAVWRDDEVRPSLDRERVLTGAPGASPRSGLFKVPKVL
jgi:aspartyl-tRNA(Asn)/glutamyl-tRNA(Gln) amidotransferase subunit C